MACWVAADGPRAGLRQLECLVLKVMTIDCCAIDSNNHGASRWACDSRVVILPTACAKLLLLMPQNALRAIPYTRRSLACPAGSGTPTPLWRTAAARRAAAAWGPEEAVTPVLVPVLVPVVPAGARAAPLWWWSRRAATGSGGCATWWRPQAARTCESSVVVARQDGTLLVHGGR